jgi:hypothetical protein
VKDSRFGSWPTAQAQTNNLKDKGTEDKNTIFLCIKNNKKKNAEKSFAFRVWVRHWKSNQKYSEHKAGITLNSLIIKRWAHQDKFAERKNEISG